ncbi:MAG: hypothetical protein HN742_34805 [Lentisphaerae bacterium]|jgi:hypothetical protein|nr:hypothetical protein [Lentisphaerota bacterium]MBT4817499.1 hypothetical protein [Lentisphaerota bacterium]MBT5612987.1 hypothetical protein [Lentisphaerota bacterium]MBT7059065.1 hypothetical protein [Lentisphaerota bacterium]MBT7847093.1 hypothetical protein [Lentisphaerota bacterium]
MRSYTEALMPLLVVSGVLILLAALTRYWRGLRVPPDPWDGEPDQVGAAPEDTPRIVCSSCLGENEPEAAFCLECGNPIGDTSSMDPLKRIQAQGWIYRRAASSPYRFLIVVGMWLIFLPMAIVSFPIEFLHSRKPGDLPGAIFDCLIWTIVVAVLCKVTANYIRRRAGTHAAESPIPNGP